MTAEALYFTVHSTGVYSARSVLAATALFEQLLQLFGTIFLTHSVHQKHSILSGSTSKHTFTKQLLIPHSGMLQRLRFTYLTNGA